MPEPTDHDNPPAAAPAEDRIPGIVGYISSEGVLYLFRERDRLKEFIRGRDFSQVGWVERAVVVEKEG